MSQRTSTTASSHSRETVGNFAEKISEIVHTTPTLVDANPLIRFRGLPASGNAIFEKDVTYNDDEDIFLAGVVTLPSDDGRYLNERVMLKSPYKTKDSISETKRFGAVPRYDGGRWHFEARCARACIQHFLRDGHDVAGPLQLFIDLLPEQSLAPDDGTISVPGLGEVTSPKTFRDRKDELSDTDTSNPSSSRGGGRTPFVETGMCPVTSCTYHSGNFASLRGHIGGMVAAGSDAHKEAGLKIDDYR
ncbi:hypothetical protein [Halorubrum laminariae]|uniref:Uncharacterized protein n=1 Tax=Halorubrum laminariae TaxID=1433523 RepID=A0ABD6BYU0_9EURY|nr:hypothetical protein [Halorubrum laminariae]